MVVHQQENIRSAEVVLRCSGLNDTLDFFVETLGFRVDTIFPAECPSVALISGYGVRIRLQQEGLDVPVVLRLRCEEPRALADGKVELTAPGGTVIQLVPADEPQVVPPNRPSFVLSRFSDKATWAAGRAGMRYRDLIPDRHGGRFIASHIQIPEGGEVPDYVHFHEVRFQMIYCYKGWVRVVYEDQGAPFVLNAGDCVLQPPRIRHRVLECSEGLEVLEISCPAEHVTHADHELALPTNDVRVERDFDGQQFVHHVAHAAPWQPSRAAGFESRDTGIAAATGGLAGVRVVRPSGEPMESSEVADAELVFTFVLQGSVALHREGHRPERLAAGDCFTLPNQVRHRLTDCSADLELLEVSLPATVDMRPAGNPP